MAQGEYVSETPAALTPSLSDWALDSVVISFTILLNCAMREFMSYVFYKKQRFAMI